jgi:hypothetical protein
LEDLIANNAKDVEIQVSHVALYINISFEDFCISSIFLSIGRLGIFSSGVTLLSLFYKV